MIRSNRTCNNPTPSCGGVYCRGISTHEETCNELCCLGKIMHYIVNRTYVAITVQLNLHLTLDTCMRVAREILQDTRK